ncbi:hypothetical protein KEM55_006013 [Ascosphaera atra]|nr:hypothetical protein KEM55_006013 [Ascosphaera atra]
MFLGHHEDDNIETALLRVSQGHRGLGLRGMPDVAHIPECEGIYGVSESGTLSLEAFEASKHYVQHRRHFNKRMGVSHFFLPVADGGVYLFRPFLEYPKARLLKTCEENNVPYVNDQTNFDFTLTPRNAVRHLLSTDQLPQALRGPSILNLVKKSRQKGDRIEELSRKCLSTFHILQHDACAGTMTVEFPDLSYPGATPADLQTHLYENEYAQALGLRNLIDVLAPTPRCAASLDKLAQATKATLRPLRDEDSGYFLPHSPFTVGGIMFQTAHPNKSARNTWFLMRQPFKHPEKYINSFAVDIPADTRNSPTQCTHWQLWDSRYWVRVRAVQVRFQEDLRYSRVVQCEGKTLNLRLRPVDEDDIAAMRVILDSTSPGDDIRGPHTHEELLTYKVLWKLLKHQAPGKVRYTLPVLSHDGEERTPVGLPSFRKDMPTIFSVVDEEGKKTHWKVRSEVQYKHVEPEFYQLTGFRKLT